MAEITRLKELLGGVSNEEYMRLKEWVKVVGRHFLLNQPAIYWSGSKPRCESGYLSRKIIMERARVIGVAYMEDEGQHPRQRQLGQSRQRYVSAVSYILTEDNGCVRLKRIRNIGVDINLNSLPLPPLRLRKATLTASDSVFFSLPVVNHAYMFIYASTNKRQAPPDNKTVTTKLTE
ncbi:hypothetical protein LguiB_032849 [Lonicera macranthoides]